ncbi:pentatricopeptide repeat-containing protein At1g07590, mitochondrial isoform X1 [Elaeis guineensis]|uniref:Pentatricopeptide repeat-containing protein At1g07590, mitochondrial isoform X1 n=1 Tax=Elaeis guineensis var. tenera TaxID=51953 RepID=A0A6J0PCM6_ELAGV|nr:pentatricopeptide repeat-containing protein At1g07590, mitochondrial isoform X1 [Elaeis guineensis]XP_029116603.1 pentatricopeptide repeat-containing protein At1g07590, mitochondrial isoform X1 [Elaeis guineensis]XP_029116604.1 pentatricopeptide repeat-containing protein At1g07590, mitochondrial isoform X1 [Elaeis guineensis]XP_029116605.1 pentatricopeptide repeat-containing protein At1g07590, mitochondrial isoform X1 [Elaeis guineensis]
MPRFRLPLFLCRRSRDLHLHSILRSFASCPLPVASPLDFPKPQEREGEPSEEKPGETLSSRVERLTRGESVVSAFQRWMRQGFAIHRGDIFHAINRLRKLKMNKRALEVMEWVIRERPYKLKELEYSYLLEFTTKIHGISHGESLFLRIPHEYQNELLYNNLVMACLDKGLIRLSLAYMRKMRELAFPISPYVYNRLIILHSSSGRKKSIPRILTQMKADGVSPHTSTYNILLKMEADDHNIEGLSKVFIEMQRAKVEPDEITFGILAIAHAVARLYTVSETYVEAIERSKTGNNWSTLDILLILYGYLGKKEKLERTWKFVEELPHARSKSFMLAIEAFGRIGHVSRAEEIWAEMKSNRELKLTKQFNSIISVYCRHGLMEKASEMFKQMEANGCEPNAITYRHLALGCLKVGLIKEALKTMNMGRSETMGFQVRRSTPWLETTHMVLEAFADLGDLENTKMLFKEFKETKYCRYTFVYNTLLKAYVKAKVYDPELLRKMILGGARPDAETYSLVRLLEQFKN